VSQLEGVPVDGRENFVGEQPEKSMHWEYYNRCLTEHFYKRHIGDVVCKHGTQGYPGKCTDVVPPWVSECAPIHVHSAIQGHSRGKHEKGRQGSDATPGCWPGLWPGTRTPRAAAG